MREPFTDLGHRIKTLRKQNGLTQQEFAAKLDVTQPTVHRWEKGSFSPDDRTLEVLAEMAGVPTAVFRYGPQTTSSHAVAVAGYVGAGALVTPIDDHGLGGGIEEIEAPPGSEINVAAVKVRGDSMLPVYGDGDILFYNRDAHSGVDAAATLNRDCVVKVLNGATYVKRVISGSGRGAYTLVSYNADPIMNARIEWAAPVKWVKRR